jgi:hypothetical protein
MANPNPNPNLILRSLLVAMLIFSEFCELDGWLRCFKMKLSYTQCQNESFFFSQKKTSSALKKIFRQKWKMSHQDLFQINFLQRNLTVF